MSILDDYQELNSQGVAGGSSGEQTPPEEEFFKSIYISGQNRTHENGTMEQIEKLQIRGHSFNHDQVFMIITHVKDVLNNETKQNGKAVSKCFSFKESSQPPWYGSMPMPDGSARICPVTSADRKAVEFCSGCKAQIIVAGILCQPTGSPILSEDKKPIFVFIRGKGVRYGNVSDYLSSLYQLDLDPVFNETGDAIREFEKRVVNHKRFVTKITKTYANSSHGKKLAFALERGNELNKEFAIELLDLAKTTMEQFRKKFDWSKKKKKLAQTQQASGVMSMENTQQPPPKTESEAPKTAEQSDGGKTFSFKDIKF
jgi:hypothetical protein